MKKLTDNKCSSLTEPSLTVKQKNFADELIRNGGNKTAAAMAAYDCTTYRSAQVTGSQMFQSPAVRAYINRRLMEAAVPDNSVDALNGALKATQPVWNAADGRFEELADHPTRLKAAVEAFKLMDVYPTQHTQQAAQPTGGEFVNLDYWVLRYLAQHKGAWPTDEQLDQFKQAQTIEVEVEQTATE